MINWVLIDDVMYHWDGKDSISCETNNGFSSTLSGSSLDGLEILDPDGVVAGELFVDFAGKSLSYMMIGNTHVDQIITYGIHESIYLSPVNELAQLTDYSDLVVFNSDKQDLWSDIAYESQANIRGDENTALNIDFLLFPPEESLELLLKQPENNDAKLFTNHSNDLSYESGMGHLTNSVDPLDMLLTHNANYTNY